MTLILRIFFRLLYREFAWSYDFIAAFVSGGRWISWVNAALPLVQGPGVLELGFGPGHLMGSLAQNGFHVFGLDASRQMVQQAQKKLPPGKNHPLLVRGLAQNLPFCSQSFNTVISTFPSGFIFQSAALQEIRRVLLPGGNLAILLSAWITDQSLQSRCLNLLFRITGQSLPVQVNDEKLLRPFVNAGLDARLHWIEIPGSRLMFVIAARN